MCLARLALRSTTLFESSIFSNSLQILQPVVVFDFFESYKLSNSMQNQTTVFFLKTKLLNLVCKVLRVARQKLPFVFLWPINSFYFNFIFEVWLLSLKFYEKCKSSQKNTFRYFRIGSAKPISTKWTTWTFGNFIWKSLFLHNPKSSDLKFKRVIYYLIQDKFEFKNAEQRHSFLTF